MLKAASRDELLAQNVIRNLRQKHTINEPALVAGPCRMEHRLHQEDGMDTFRYLLHDLGCEQCAIGVAD